MTDPAPLARIAGSAARKSLLAFLGPAPTTTTEIDGHSAKEHSRRDERAELENVWKDSVDDKAGVGVAPTSSNDSRSKGAAAPLVFGAGASTPQSRQEEAQFRKRVLGNGRDRGRKDTASGSTPASGSLAGPGTVLGKRVRGVGQWSSSKAAAVEVSSDEEGGRSAALRKGGKGKNKTGAGATGGRVGKQKAVSQVETFQSMQIEPEEQSVLAAESNTVPQNDDGSAPNGQDNVVSADAEDELQTRKRSVKSVARPKSYLDEILLAKEARTAKKKKKRQKSASNNEAD